LSGSLPSLSLAFKRLAPGSGPLGCLVWSLWAPRASGACGSRAGDPRAAAVFFQLTPALEFADLGADYGTDAEGMNVDRTWSGGFQEFFCLALWGLLSLWRLWFCAGVPQAAAVFHGLSLILGFVCGIDGSKTGCLLIGAVQDQVQFGCFVLRLGVSRASFGLLSREGFFLRGALGLPLAPPWGLGASGPCVGPQAVSAFPLTNLILVST
jgi:hypothetical protein